VAGVKRALGPKPRARRARHKMRADSLRGSRQPLAATRDPFPPPEYGAKAEAAKVR
jgi:hypothetical protein